jgi:putative cell wall-binding protein
MHRSLARVTAFAVATTLLVALLPGVAPAAPAAATARPAVRSWLAETAQGRSAARVQRAQARAARALPGRMTPAAAPTVRATAISDIPGVPLLGNVATGTMPAVDPNGPEPFAISVYAFPLAAGERAVAAVDVTPTVPGAPADFAILAYGPTATSVFGGSPIAVGTPVSDNHARAPFGASASEPGTYYVALLNQGAAFNYRMQVTTSAADPLDAYPGLPLGPGTTTGTLSLLHPNNVYSVALEKGDLLMLDVAARNAPIAAIYGPETTTTDISLAPQDFSRPMRNGIDRMIYEATGTANYQVVLWGLDYLTGDLSQDTTYAVDCSIVPAAAQNDDEIPGVALSPALSTTGTAEATGSLDPSAGDRDDVRRVMLRSGQRVKASLEGTAALWVYGPRETTLAKVTGTPDASWTCPPFAGPDSGVGEFLVPETGFYYFDVSAAASETTGASDWRLSLAVDEPRLARTAGSDRYETSARVSRDVFEMADTVVLATGAGYADALAAAGLAGTVQGPVLLTPRDALPHATKREIARLGAREVYIVGGTAAVDNAVKTDLEAMGCTVTRIAGADRYATSVRVAEKMDAIKLAQDGPGGGFGGGSAFVVSGTGFADALSAAPYAAGNSTPILLTKPTGLPAAVSGYIAKNVGDVTIVGGTAAVSTGVEDQIGLLNDQSVYVARVSGTNRFSTSYKLALAMVNDGLADPSLVYLATGRSFADALGGGAAVGAYGGVMVLTESTGLSPEVRPMLGRSVDQYVRLLGGTGALGAAVETQAKGAMK